MRMRKMDQSLAGQKGALPIVGNTIPLRGKKTQYEHKKTFVESNHQFDPYLTAAILKRNIKNIKSSINVIEYTDNHIIMSEDQHNVFKNIFKDIYAQPIKLAMKICDSETLETTQTNDPTRFDVLHCLAENFDALVDSARQKGNPIPDLKDTLEYARGLNSHVPLHTFILGLSEERKEEAANLLNAKKVRPTVTPVT